MRSGPMQKLPEVAAEFGVRFAPLLRKAGLPADVLANAETVVPLYKVALLTSLCAERTGCPHIALLAGQRSSIAQLGPVGLMMQHAPTVEAAWRGLMLNLHLNGHALVPSLTVRDEVAVLRFAPVARDVEDHRGIIEFSLALACVVLRLQCGRNWSPTEVRLAYRAPADVGPYRRFFRSPVHFGAGQSSLLFSPAWLKHPLKGASRQVRLELQQVLQDLIHQQDLDLPTRVRRSLFALISQDQASIDAAANMLGMHKRTLNRRLAVNGTTFALLLGEVRFQLACQLLAETDLPLVDVAAVLNYTEASAFSRAFRSWARMAPSMWRSQHTSSKMGTRTAPPPRAARPLLTR
ncbi:MAG: AraC family transcriptional regulator [Acidimicrobiia bacterium]